MTFSPIPAPTSRPNIDLHREMARDGILPPERGALACPPLPPCGPRPEHYQRIWLDGTETTAELRARGVPARTARTAVKRGWYTLSYHQPQCPQAEGPGLFATLTNAYTFAMAQMRHVLRTQDWGTLTRENLEDAVQDVLLWAWERRHGAHILATNFPGSISAVIRVK